jgi:hypothetical protein
MNNSLVLNTFIKQLDECLEDISNTYNTDNRFVKCKLYFDTIKKSNPKILITLWKKKIMEPYKEQIFANDVTFFLTKDYKGDVNENYNEAIDNAIDDLRNVIRGMSQENISTSMKYIQNLCKLSELYI